MSIQVVTPSFTLPTPRSQVACAAMGVEPGVVEPQESVQIFAPTGAPEAPASSASGWARALAGGLLGLSLLGGAASAAPPAAAAMQVTALATAPASATRSDPAPFITSPPPRVSWTRVDTCYSRPPSSAADALGMPETVCIDRAGVQVPHDYPLPFVRDGALLLEGTPASGAFWVSGGARDTNSWNIVGSVMSNRLEPRCGKLNDGFVAVYVDIDLDGHILPTQPQVRGYVMDTSPLCPTPARSVEIPFTPVR